MTLHHEIPPRSRVPDRPRPRPGRARRRGHRADHPQSGQHRRARPVLRRPARAARSSSGSSSTGRTSTAALPEIEADLASTLDAVSRLEWTLTDQSVPKRMAILASKQDHCLLDLLWRHRRGDLPVTIPMVVSNHTTTAEDVRSLRRAVLPRAVTQGPTSRRPRPRSSSCSTATSTSSSSPATCRSSRPTSSRSSACPVINIHHSFLPAFVGAEPYQQGQGARREAHRRDQSHYVTNDLDEGPIIEQDTSGSPTATRSPTSRAAAPTSSARCSLARCSGTPKTASSATATTRSSSDRSRSDR